MARPPIACVVLDFDGTCTSVDDEAVPFLAGFRADLARRCGRELDEEWARAEATIRRAPDAHGWRYEGRIVAPANADPYVLSTSIAHLVLDALGLYEAPGDRSAVMTELFNANYGRAAPVFRPDARRVVEALVDSGRPVFVVTNSMTDAVSAKLEALSPRAAARLRVFGNARKYVLAEPAASDARFDAVPEMERFPGLDRPVYLRRGRYYEVLRRIAEETRVPPDETLVCGDIFELDLALPRRLGMHLHLVARPEAPEYERRAVREHATGAVSDTLAAVLARVA